MLSASSYEVPISVYCMLLGTSHYMERECLTDLNNSFFLLCLLFTTCGLLWYFRQFIQPASYVAHLQNSIVFNCFGHSRKNYSVFMECKGWMTWSGFYYNSYLCFRILRFVGKISVESMHFCIKIWWIDYALLFLFDGQNIHCH